MWEALALHRLSQCRLEPVEAWEEPEMFGTQVIWRQVQLV